MTQDEIIRMAQEAHRELVTLDYPGHIGQLDPWTMRLLERFAALVAAHEREKLHNEIATLQCDIEEMYSRADVDYLIGVEREACAKVCENLYKHLNHDADCRKLWPHTKMINDQYAAAIRSRCLQGSRSENDA